jgi:hypothetical protein
MQSSVTNPPNTCYPIVKELRLEATTGQQIAMFELQAWSSGINVALYGTASQTSNRNNGEILDASRAIDGNNVTYSHTNDPNAAWEVDLKWSYPIEHVLIFNRYCGNNPSLDPLGCLCRLSNSTLSLVDEADAVVATTSIGNTCNQWTIFESFTPNYPCPVLVAANSSITKSIRKSENVSSFDTSSNLTLDTGDSTLNTFNVSVDDDLGLDSDIAWWVSIALVYSGSRWFGTFESGSEESFRLDPTECKLIKFVV